MNRLFLYLFEPLNNLRKWIYITLVTILFLSSFFFFVGVYSNVVNTDDFTVSLRNNETYLSYWQMYIAEPTENIMSGAPRMHEEVNYLVINDPDEKKRIKIESDQFICNLYNMQNDDFIIEYNASRSHHNTNYHSIQASESFFENEYLPIFKGRSITKEDFDEIRNAKSPEFTINVIAGYSFSEKYEVGDIIRGQYTEGIQYEHGDEDLSDYTLEVYDQNNAAYRVVGFIEKGVTFANSSGSIQSTDDYVFVPFIPEIGIFFLK